ncbi:T9SS type A sorting domain-containing protein [Flavobacterium alkalisoli]|uniref:T9SS type A sorting domain-containing protein n=1 Tax=Flavobacterium alkalisoli TaxID=2602769 RepID=A0A5B9FU80_9FLAO|nr:T9SS type A sorting domain-containing protein [Flavobacterium alkalisoli]QEE50873.1 T9SS type A sorting domain-containing protein [Flavobacterium alkalisoli]
MKLRLPFLTLMVLFVTSVFAQTTANQPPDITQCSWEIFNLTQQNEIILGDQDPQSFLVTYHETQIDAEEGTNPIPNSMQYVSISNPQTIYARVSNVNDTSFATTSFQIEWWSWDVIPINQPAPIQACYTGDEEFVTVDLTNQEEYILGEIFGQMTVTYYLTGNDVEMGTNPITNPETFEWPIEGLEYVFVRIENPVTGCYNVTVIYAEIVACTDNVISGTLAYDDGENGCDDGTPGAFVMLSLTHDNDVFYTYTDANGNYTFLNVPDGVNYINVMGQGPQTYQTVPASYTLTTPGVIEGNNFCLTAPDPYNDVMVYIIPYQLPRPGFPFHCKLLLQNLGNTTLNGAVTLEFDDTIMAYDSSSPMMNLTGNTLDVYYTNLEPFTPQYVDVYFTVFTPPTVNAGDILNLVANVTAVEGDDNLSNNVDDLDLEVVNSWDPNDIACREGEYITEEQADGYLHYLIRFQNTGNADAVNIRVEDILDDKFDVSTFQPIASSHDYRIEIENNTVQFIFDNINLPGEEINEPESHGYISYRIKPMSNVQLGDTFEATAGIYFDFNEPIVTNTATTTIQSLGIAQNSKGLFTLYPNPAKNIVNIDFAKNTANTVSISVSDISGKTVLAKNISNGENSFDVSSLTSGMYFVNIKADNKQQIIKLMID